jgi:hypothetical protein
MVYEWALKEMKKIHMILFYISRLDDEKSLSSFSVSVSALASERNGDEGRYHRSIK